MTAIGMTYARAFPAENDEPLPGIEHGQLEYAMTRQAWRTAPLT
jgi:hypothetical protein